MFGAALLSPDGGGFKKLPQTVKSRTIWEVFQLQHSLLDSQVLNPYETIIIECCCSSGCFGAFATEIP